MLRFVGGFNKGPFLRVSSYGVFRRMTTGSKLVAGQNLVLQQELKDWRKQTASEMFKPVYFILTNKAIDEISFRRPISLQELGDIPGIGPSKIKAFGPRILHIVRQYSSSATPSQTIPTDEVLSDSEFLSSLKPKKKTKASKVVTDENSTSSTSSKSGKTSKVLSPEEISNSDSSSQLVSIRQLNSEQKAAATQVLSGNSIFITGSAGTGKTFLLRYVIQELILKHGEGAVAITAPTGISAITVGGQTIHSFAGIGLGKGEKSKIMSNVTKNNLAVDRWINTSVLVIDEISMLDRALFELLDEIARTIRKIDKPFGGIQVIAVGDFMQLPPVRKDSISHFCFQSSVWEALGLRLTSGIINLKKVERQNDPVFIKHLNEVRLGQLTPEFATLLKSCLVTNKPLPVNGIIPTKLYAINKEVDSENSSRLAELKGEIVSISAEDMWQTKPMKTAYVTSIKTAVQNMIPDSIDLKVGAQVMLLRNRTNYSTAKTGKKASALQLVNGSRGKITGFTESSVRPGLQIPTVQFDNGVVTSVGPVEFKAKGPGGDGCLIRLQIPLKLAWAATIHKSQGCTLTCAELMLANSFDYGQGYVALSRVRSLDGLWLSQEIRPSAIKAHPAVLAFYGIQEENE